jgi:hypothetical protein
VVAALTPIVPALYLRCTHWEGACQAKALVDHWQLSRAAIALLSIRRIDHAYLSGISILFLFCNRLCPLGLMEANIENLSL